MHPGNDEPKTTEPEERTAADHGLRRLVDIMRTLRGPEGCPWDRKQDWRSLRRYVLEEAYEVVQAIDDEDPPGLAGELGDLLLQIVFLSQLAAEQADFTIDDVVAGIIDKLIRRHPHVFGNARADDAEQVVRRWEMLKLEERGGGSVLDDMPASLPALARAEKLGRRAAQIGFDWPGPEQVMEKVVEELDELSHAKENARREQVRRAAEVEEEIGDVLFAVANLARHLGLSPEVALRRANEKFERRFRAIEHQIETGETTDPEALDRLWEQVKEQERDSS